MYLVMPMYGLCLQDVFESRKGQFTHESICSLGVQLINIFERIHDAGYVFNDLKLDNLMFDVDANSQQLKKSKLNIFEKNNVNIIDFGYATPYLLEDDKTHIKKSQLDEFHGNMIFSSLNHLMFQ